LFNSSEKPSPRSRCVLAERKTGEKEIELNSLFSI